MDTIMITKQMKSLPIRDIVFACLILATTVQSHAGFEVPGEVPAGPIVLEHGTIHTMTSGTIEDGTLVIEDGKISRLGQADGISPPEGENVTRIDLTGKHVYPGLIDADTTMGLVEIDLSLIHI